MKRLVFCFDGTWNRIVAGYPTNVSRIAHAVKTDSSDANGNTVKQVVYYDEGVGTHDLGKWIGRIANKISGALGLGLEQNIVEAYTFLILNYEPGDEMYVFGFSRGAFTARSFIGLIRNCAILPKRRLFNIREAVDLYTSRDENDHPNNNEACHYRYKNCPHLVVPGDEEWRQRSGFVAEDDNPVPLRISYLGVWDTVGALGIPENFGLSNFVNRKYQFHDTQLSWFVRSARHAVAADEKRKTFVPTMWTNLRELNGTGPERYFQRIYPGTHSAIGGGGPIRGLSDGPLEWIFRGAQSAGLEFDTDIGSPLYGILPDHRAPLFNEEGKFEWTRKDGFVGAGLANRKFNNISVEQIDETIMRRWHDPAMAESEDGIYRPESLKNWHDFIASQPPKTHINLDDDIFDGICHADRSLKTPLRVDRYKVGAQDNWQKIASKFYGDEQLWKAVFLYNFDARIVYAPNGLYATSEILIPVYR